MIKIFATIIREDQILEDIQTAEEILHIKKATINHKAVYNYVRLSGCTIKEIKSIISNYDNENEILIKINKE